MPAIPESTKTSLAQRLRAHARDHWPQLCTVHVRYHGPFAYVEGRLPDGEILPLMRLRYGGSTARWGFVIYLASSNNYQDPLLPASTFASSQRSFGSVAHGRDIDNFLSIGGFQAPIVDRHRHSTSTYRRASSLD